MFTNRKRGSSLITIILRNVLRRQAQLLATPYHLTKKELSVDLTSYRIRRHRRALRSRRRPRFRRNGVAELTRRSVFERLFHILLTPTRLFRRNKKRSYLFGRRKQKNPLYRIDFDAEPLENIEES